MVSLSLRYWVLAVGKGVSDLGNGEQNLFWFIGIDRCCRIRGAGFQGVGFRMHKFISFT